MGVSTDAIIFYGFLIDDESDDHSKIENILFEDDGYDKIEALEKKYKVELVRHCSSDYTKYAVAVGESIIASRGSPKEVSLPVTEEGDRLKRFAEELGITYQGPKYWLVSWWG